MRVVFVNTPMQDGNTLNPQIIDGEVCHWCVVSEMMKQNETLQQWLKRKYKSLKIQSLTDGIYLYDIHPVYLPEREARMMIRYQWIKK